MTASDLACHSFYASVNSPGERNILQWVGKTVSKLPGLFEVFASPRVHARFNATLTAFVRATLFMDHRLDSTRLAGLLEQGVDRPSSPRVAYFHYVRPCGCVTRGRERVLAPRRATPLSDAIAISVYFSFSPSHFPLPSPHFPPFDFSFCHACVFPDPFHSLVFPFPLDAL